MGRSSKSDRKRHRHNVEGVDEGHHSSNVDPNESKHRDSSSRKHRHHHYRVNSNNDDDNEQHEIFRTEKDKGRGRKDHEKKHRGNRSRMRQYSSDDSDSSLHELSKKKHHRKHDDRRRDDSGSERDARKRKKRHRNDHDGERKKSKRDVHHGVNAVSDAAQPSKLLVDKSKLHSLGERLGHPPDDVLDPEGDYFAQNQRFRMYLYRECGLTFDELSSKDARHKFQDFVQHYNAGDLEEGYYAPHLPKVALDECPTTRHQWSLKITHQDTQNLQMLQEGIRKQTEYQSADVLHSSGRDANIRQSSQSNTSAPVDPNNEVVRVQNVRVMNRRLREHVQTTIDELTGGKKEGRERQMEKRQERAAKIHGASKYHQADMIELDDTALYGGNADDEFHRLAAQSRQRVAAQEAKKEERLLELQQKEKDKQNAMLEMLGLSHKIGQSKIQIQPRNDPP